MTLRRRKLAVAAAVAAVLLLANAVVIARWLDDAGVVGWAAWVRSQYLTGTAIAVILALLVLLARPERGDRWRWIDRCPVCGRRHLGRGRYCPVCGSRV